jgi:hypothetical protein
MVRARHSNSSVIVRFISPPREIRGANTSAVIVVALQTILRVTLSFGLFVVIFDPRVKVGLGLTRIRPNNCAFKDFFLGLSARVPCNRLMKAESWNFIF